MSKNLDSGDLCMLSGSLYDAIGHGLAEYFQAEFVIYLRKVVPPFYKKLKMIEVLTRFGILYVTEGTLTFVESSREN